MRTFEKGKLSVIVPCYNVEEYIRECLDSLVKQTYKNLEVIMVDDGSPDNTGVILDEYDAKYKNFYAVHTDNGGLSAARNAGLPYVTGEYMAFVDSDDVVIQDAYERLVGSLMQTGSDMASGFVQRFNSKRVYASGLHKKAIPETILKTNINKSPFLVYDTTAWNKVYKTSLFLDNDLKFPVGLTYEDIPVSMQLHLLAKSVDVIAEPVYKWRVRESSNRSITQKRISLKLFNDRIETLRMTKRAIDKLAGSQKLKDAFNYKILDLDIAMYLDSFQSANETTLFAFQRETYKFLRDYDLNDIKRLDIRKQIQYYSLLAGDFTDFKRYGFQTKNIGNINLKKNKYVYNNSSIQKNIKKQVQVDHALEFKQSITNIDFASGNVTIAGMLTLKTSARLPKVDEKIQAYLINTENNKKIRINFLRIFKRTRKTFFIKKEPTNFQISFKSKEAERKIGTGSWKIKIEFSAKNIFVEDYLKGPKKQKLLILNPKASEKGIITNHFNRRWELVFDDALETNKPRVNQNWIQDIKILNDKVVGTAYIIKKIAHPQFHLNTKDGSSFPCVMNKVLSSHENYNVYSFEWHTSHLLSRDTSFEGEVALYDEKNNALLSYTFQNAQEVETTTNQRGVSLNVNRQQRKVALFLYKNILTVRKIEVNSDDSLEIYFTEKASSKKMLYSSSITLQSTDGKNSYKGFAELSEDASSRYKVLIRLFDRNAKATILSGTYSIYLNEINNSINFQYLLIANELKGKSIGTIRKKNFKSDIKVNANGVIIIEMQQEWSKIDSTNVKRAINYSVLYPLMRLLPLKPKIVMFESLWGAYFNDNPRAIYEYWKEKYPNYKFVWSFKDLATSRDTEVTAVRKFSFKYWYYLARAKYLIENTNFPNQYAKRKGQIEVQTLHGTFMKTMGFDEPQFRKGSTKAQRNFMMRNSRWDYLISPSEYMDMVTKQAFDYHKKILPVGFPRNDLLINGNNPKNIHQLKAKMGIPESKKVILYAPTFRQNGVVDLELDIAAMQKRLGDEYLLLVRLHYLVANAVDLHRFSGFARDMSSYGSIEELYLVSDVLITDYSSVMFDYGYLRKPMIFFAYDLDWYLDANNRGVYLDYIGTVPGPVLKNTEQIIDQLLNFDNLSANYQKKLEQFYDRFCLYGRDGKAAEKTVETVISTHLHYPQTYTRGLLLEKFIHLLGLNDLKMSVFNYLGKHVSRKNIIIFESDAVRQYGDSPRSIYKYLQKKNTKYRLIWRIDRKWKTYFKSQHVPYVVKDSLIGIFTQASAKYWFTNTTFPKNWKKPRGMKVIQTTSGTPIKKIGADVVSDFIPGKTITKFQKEQVYEARKWDYIVAGNEFAAHVLQNAYRKQTNQIVRSGLPKNDYLIRSTKREKIALRRGFGLEKVKTVILYAPTWRDNEVLNVDKYFAKLHLDLGEVAKNISADAVVLVRMHHKVSENRPNLSHYGSQIRDVTDYPNLNDLLLVSDILITDYSSIAFDFANLKRPIIFYADDLPEYENRIRGLYIDYEKELPGYFANTTEKVIERLNGLIDNPTLPKRFPDFYNDFCLWERGNSTQKLLDVVFNNKKYVIKTIMSEWLHKKVYIKDGAQFWSGVYGTPQARFLKNLDSKNRNYVVIEVASLVDPVQEKQTGFIFAQVQVENKLGWVAVSDLQEIK